MTRLDRGECECPIEHTVSKLGHSPVCPYHGVDMPIFGVALKPGCPPRHADETPHDFNWATYVDVHHSTGVCRCGHTAMSESMFNGP